MMRDGFKNLNKFKLNLSNKIDRLWRRLKSIESNQKNIGKISRKRCKIFLKLTLRIQGQ